MNLTGQRVKSPQRTYIVGPLIREGETYDVHLAIIEGDTKDRSVIMKVAGDPSVDKYVDNEFEILTHLNGRLSDASRAIKLMIPEPIERFEFQQHVIIITDYAVNYFTLEQIREQYPDGIPPEHGAWMFRRMLLGLIAAHIEGVIHGKVLPRNVIVHSGDRSDDLRHTAVLVDWTCAIRQSDEGTWSRVPAVNKVFKSFYPPEVLRGETASPQADLAMAANCAIYLLGGDVETGALGDKAPDGMTKLLQACRAPNPAQRPRDLVEFDNQFRSMLVTYFGPPKFVELPLVSS